MFLRVDYHVKEAVTKFGILNKKADAPVGSLQQTIETRRD